MIRLVLTWLGLSVVASAAAAQGVSPAVHPGSRSLNLRDPVKPFPGERVLEVDQAGGGGFQHGGGARFGKHAPGGDDFELVPEDSPKPLQIAFHVLLRKRLEGAESPSD